MARLRHVSFTPDSYHSRRKVIAADLLLRYRLHHPILRDRLFLGGQEEHRTWLIGSRLVAAHSLGLRDRLLDHLRIGHVDDGELRLITGRRDLDGPYAEDAIDESLGDT